MTPTTGTPSCSNAINVANNGFPAHHSKSRRLANSRVTCDKAQGAIDWIQHPHVSSIFAFTDCQSKLFTKDAVSREFLFNGCSDRLLHFQICLGDRAVIRFIDDLNFLTKPCSTWSSSMNGGRYPKYDLQIFPEISARDSANATWSSVTTSEVTVAVLTTGWNAAIETEKRKTIREYGNAFFGGNKSGNSHAADPAFGRICSQQECLEYSRRLERKRKDGQRTDHIKDLKRMNGQLGCDSSTFHITQSVNQVESQIHVPQLFSSLTMSAWRFGSPTARISVAQGGCPCVPSQVRSLPDQSVMTPPAPWTIGTCAM